MFALLEEREAMPLRSPGGPPGTPGTAVIATPHIEPRSAVGHVQLGAERTGGVVAYSARAEASAGDFSYILLPGQ